ncbi:MAG TPA: rhodanese-like domain-containing protein [Blastocatellia bacterium]|nr:rhodanese-like domain-containing protein [Blastocatellia bacterium]
MSARTNYKLALLLILSIVVIATAKDMFLLPEPAVAHAADDTWQPSEMIQADELAQLLSKEPKPVVLQVGIIHLYRINHIPGAKYAGPANTAEGLESLKKLAEKLPRTTQVVCYCGCCPWQDCPNIRPAYKTLQGMGFKNVKALYLPTNFAQDWVTKGLPVEKGGS